MMPASRDRILTTHVGSLPRADRLQKLMAARESGEATDGKALAGEIRKAVAGVVQKQTEIGLDIIDDGEQSKAGFVVYVGERLGGFEPLPGARTKFATSKECRAFPDFYHGAHSGTQPPRVASRGPITYAGHAQLKTDIENLKSALAGAPHVAAFMPAASPASVEGWQTNEYYKSDEECLFAIAEAMREEYEAIVAAGFFVQVDDPRLVMQYMLDPDASIDATRKWAALRVEALNHALRNIPAEKIRHHTCYGINMGPRVHDLEMRHIVDIILTIRAGAYLFEAANPRHEHEWRLWEEVKLPEDKTIVPGVVTHTSVLVEHPELVAERIMRFAGLVGRERVIAGVDCGFASTPRAVPEVHESVVWAKLQSLVEGARLATRRLWQRI